MNLRETRLDRRLTQPQIVAKMKEVEPRVDVALYSKMESGICLPTPPLMGVMDIQPVQVPRRIQVTKPQDASPLLRHHRVAAPKGPVPGRQIPNSRCPGRQLGRRIIPCIHQMHRVI